MSAESEFLPPAKKQKIDENITDESEEQVAETNDGPKLEVLENVQEEKTTAESGDSKHDNVESEILASASDQKETKSNATEDASQKSETEKARDISTRILETDVGIKEYISPCPGFQAVIKQRYSDFLVNEISQDGKVVELTNTDLPPTVPVPNTQASSYTTVAELITDEDLENLKELQRSQDKKKSILIKTSDDKSVRGKLHQAIEAAFPGLNTSTVTKDNQKYIEARMATNRGNGLRQWPKGRGDYCKFVLYKEAKDTMDAIGLISSKMRLKSSLFQYAGTKDKRAKTSQEITVYRVAAEKLKDVNKQLRNIVTGNYSYTSSKLQLGQLKGNKFTVVLRSVMGTEDQIQSGMTSLRDHGFINYYGMQRFGVFSVPTHHIGRALLSSNWKEAVELILKPRAGEDKMISEAREFWWKTRDSKEALSKFPKYAYIERNILQGLADRGANDYMGAFNKVARNTRLMYVHAYQSYIWNTVVSDRVKKHGLQPVCGDLVIPHKSYTSTDETEEGPGESTGAKVTPTVIDDSNIGEYTVYDVVLPKPGYDVVYPTNDLESLYKDLMETDGLDYQNMKSKHKDFSLSGDYRHIVVKPANVSWKLYRYNDFNVPLALSDWDKMNNNPEAESIEGGSQLALRLELTLPTSCYATMALRELMKIDTSSTYQATLNT